MNLVGKHGTGESVWLGFFLYEVLMRFTEVARMRGDIPFAEHCHREATQMRGNIEQHGWDGAWYHRAYFDDGSPLGSAGNPECQIDIVINGVSKLYGMTGFRIGWVIANRNLVEVMTNVQAQTTSCPAAILQAAAEGALHGVQTYVESLRLTIENNRNVILQEFKTFNGIRIAKPQGTFYCLPDFRAYGDKSVKISDFLLRKALVVTVPGVEFGMEGFIRLSYAGSVKDITEGIAQT